METKTEKESSMCFFYFCMLSANLLGIVAGMSISWSSPVLPKLEKDNSDNPLGTKISDSDSSWIVSLAALGACFGPFMAAFAAEKFGRKWAMISIGIPYVVTSLILAFAQSVWLYLLARTIVGFSGGGTFTVLPIYISELSPDSIRGTMGGTMNVFIVSGILLSYVIGPFISILWFNIVCAAVAVVFVVNFTLFMPETPQCLISKKKELEAKNVLIRLRNTTEVDDEFVAISDLVRENSGGRGTLKDLTTHGNIKALIVAVSLVSFQHLSGINVVMVHAQLIFETSGSSIPADISAIIIGGVQVCASVVTPLLADKAGRKFLLMFSAAGMLFAEVTLGVYFYLKDDGTNVADLFWLPISCLVIFVIMYNSGFAALPWTVMSEIFAPNVKGLASSLTASSCSFLSFILMKFFGDLSKEIGIGGLFWIFSGFNLLAVLFVLFYVPETKRKSQKEIQEMFGRKS